jgi:hypothetical protein
MSNEIHTHTGIWTNWSHGKVQGATLTLTQQHGTILAAFLAIYVSFAGGMFWRILSFALHQMNTTTRGNTRDWLHYQRQVILRNSGSGSGEAAWSLFMLSFSSVGSRSRCLLHFLPTALLALLSLVLFSVAGIFTSAITKGPGNFTLIQGPHCGGVLGTDINLNSTNADPNWLFKTLADTIQASTYVQECYQNATSSFNCGTFVRPNIPFSVNKNASCPFESSFCQMGPTAAFSMDTGPLDSHVDFGINAAPKDRILFRRVATCAPIHGTSFAANRNTTSGPMLYVEAGPYEAGANYTFEYNKLTGNVGVGYTLR